MKSKRIISLALVCLLLAALIPTAAYSAGNGKSIQAGGSAIAKGDTVYYGSGGKAWRVLSLNGNGGTYSDGKSNVEADSALFLFSEAALFQTAFDDEFSDGLSNSYTSSTLRATLNDYFTGSDLSAVLETTKGEASTTLGGWPYSDPGLSGDRLFAMSANELQEYLGYTDNQTTWTEGLGGTTGWWLRSADVDSTSLAGFIYRYGYPYFRDVDYDYDWARPAFNLNLNSVLFTSAAVGGKSSGAEGADALKEIAGYDGKEWKVTVKDEAHAKFATVPCDTSYDSTTGVATVAYKEAKTETGEYISAVIKNSDGAITYYGRIATSTSATGYVTINTKEKLKDGDTLYVFNEQYHDGKATDYASELIEVPLTPIGHKYGSWTKLDDKQHQRECEHDTSHIEKEDHTWDAGRITTEPTTENEGIKTYTCEVCKATRTEPIDKLTKPSYEAKDESGNSIQSVTWQKGSGKNLDLTFKRSEDDHLTYGLFGSLEIGGKAVGNANYGASEGSLKLSIKPEYLETLAVGDHTVKVIFRDGSTTVKLTVIAAAPQPTPAPKPSEKSTAPKTGDESNLSLYGSLMLLSVVAIIVLLLHTRKRKAEK